MGLSVDTYEALVATGREAYLKLRKSAGVYGVLLDLLKAHKWIYIKLTTDDGFRAAFKLNRKRGIDRLREAYRQNNGETPTVSHAEAEGDSGKDPEKTPLFFKSSYWRSAS